MQPIAGAVGGIFALVCGGVAFYLVRQRRLRQEARLRMKASSRRFMGSQDSAYGNTHKDGSVNIGAASRQSTVMLQVKVLQEAGAPPPGAGGRRPSRSTSMRK